ncbi:MAG: hypothetical protein HYX41_08030 [Bdellovibrio sp.]|nr:hypothetical protein [Bdellovibrio sp.]
MLKFCLLFPVCFSFHFAIAAGEPHNPSSPAHEAPQTPASKHSHKHHDSTKKGKKRREKDAEGTKAQNRFEPEINAKSPYKLGGQALEVDTD